MDFFEINKSLMEHQGFWTEESKNIVMFSIESRYKTDVLREWFITDIVLNGERFIIKWKKRLYPLDDEQLKEKYGRVD